ncbi:hypothetical protein B0H63DRAFT_537414 [Podospora didyma]|uniref:Uncharacterized protein n=1 Tax=Podospora didyma TaxID=330526 RepID=A0AAE0NX78_9PEZI|nr:hypothetical protein B0H63DRAFT_537414 [Podospora didyma]
MSNGTGSNLLAPLPQDADFINWLKILSGYPQQEAIRAINDAAIIHTSLGFKDFYAQRLAGIEPNSPTGRIYEWIYSQNNPREAALYLRQVMLNNPQVQQKGYRLPTAHQQQGYRLPTAHQQQVYHPPSAQQQQGPPLPPAHPRSGARTLNVGNSPQPAYRAHDNGGGSYTAGVTNQNPPAIDGTCSIQTPSRPVAPSVAELLQIETPLKDWPVYIQGFQDLDRREVEYLQLNNQNGGDSSDFPEDFEEQETLIRRLMAALANCNEIFEQPRLVAKKGAGQKKDADVDSDANANEDEVTTDAAAVKYVKKLKNFELEMLAWKLLRRTREAQSGAINIPKYSPGWKYTKFESFTKRLDAVVWAVNKSKALVKNIMMPSSLARIAADPKGEILRKKTNQKLNGRRDDQVALANHVLNEGLAVMAEDNTLRDSRGAVVRRSKPGKSDWAIGKRTNQDQPYDSASNLPPTHKKAKANATTAGATVEANLAAAPTMVEGNAEEETTDNPRPRSSSSAQKEVVGRSGPSDPAYALSPVLNHQDEMSGVQPRGYDHTRRSGSLSSALVDYDTVPELPNDPDRFYVPPISQNPPPMHVPQFLQAANPGGYNNSPGIPINRNLWIPQVTIRLPQAIDLHNANPGGQPNGFGGLNMQFSPSPAATGSVMSPDMMVDPRLVQSSPLHHYQGLQPDPNQDEAPLDPQQQQQRGDNPFANLNFRLDLEEEPPAPNSFVWENRPDASREDGADFHA